MFWMRINIAVYLEKKHIDEKLLILKIRNPAILKIRQEACQDA